jgi:hypothetical protein
MENYINQVLDIPKTVGNMLPGNNFNSVVDNAEGNINKWTGLIYKGAATIFILGAIYNVMNPFWNDGLGSGKEMVAVILSSLVWLYAAFPMSQVIRSAGEKLESSSSSIVEYVFKDLVVTNIKLVGQLLALSALFGAFALTISWVADLPTMDTMGIAGDVPVIRWMFELPLIATMDFANWIGFEQVAMSLFGEWETWQFAGYTGEALSWEGFIGVCWAFAGVVLILVRLYISVAIYSFFFNLVAAFMRWFKNPYFPTKSI